MPKIVDYPRASLKASFILAQAVDDLGGTATAEMAADKMGKKIGGSFRSLMAAAAKFGLLATKKGRLSTTALYREYKLAYSKTEQEQVARRAFLSVALFRSVYDRFKTQKLPVDHFEKLLIREFEVHELIASRVAKYFVEGAKLIGLLNPDYTFRDVGLPSDSANGAPADEKTESDETAGGEDVRAAGDNAVAPKTFAVRITGPGMDSVISILEEEDLQIVEAMLKKVARSLRERSTASDGEVSTS
jgi:hypothetical protein